MWGLAELENLLFWIFTMAGELSWYWQEASVPLHLGLATGLLDSTYKGTIQDLSPRKWWSLRATLELGAIFYPNDPCFFICKMHSPLPWPLSSQPHMALAENLRPYHLTLVQEWMRLFRYDTWSTDLEYSTCLSTDLWIREELSYFFPHPTMQPTCKGRTSTGQLLQTLPLKKG